MDAFDSGASTGGGGGSGGGGGGFAPAHGAPRARLRRGWRAGGSRGTTVRGARQAAAPNREFEATHTALAAKLADWQPPEGSDPAEVAALQERLAGFIEERYQPRPGQSAQEAVAELHDDFELRIDSYVQSERIDALVEAEQAEQAGARDRPEAPADETPATDDPAGGASSTTEEAPGDAAEPPTGVKTAPRGPRCRPAAPPRHVRGGGGVR